MLEKYVFIDKFLTFFYLNEVFTKKTKLKALKFFIPLLLKQRAMFLILISVMYRNTKPYKCLFKLYLIYFLSKVLNNKLLLINFKIN